MTKPKWENITVRLGDLRPWADNPRLSTKAQAQRIIKSFEKFGQVITVAVDPDLEVLDGHQRLSALLTIYGEDYKIDARQSDRKLELQERKELIINLHTSAVGSWDWSELANSWSAGDLQEWGMNSDSLKTWNNDANNLKELLNADNAEPVDAEPQIDRVAELAEKWQTKSGQLWKLGEHRLLIGDCTVRENVERLMGGERADCVFTSFPYAVGVDYGETYEDTIENLRGLIFSLSTLFLDIVIDGGFAVLNFGDIAPARNIAKSAEPCEYPMALEYYPVFRAAGWLLWSRRVWCKPNARVNSLWCIGSNRAATDWEHIWTFRKQGEAIVKRVDGKYRSALGWIDTSKMEGVEIGKGEHGAGMASSIAESMIAIHSRDNSIIHEPFCGTGTTIIAAHNLNRRCYAMEISEKYGAVILERFFTATGITPELVE